MKEFEVRFPKTDLIVIGLIYLAFAVICALMFAFSNHFKFSVIFSIIVAIMCGLTIISNCSFYLRVSNDVFKVRTKFGKSYQFNIKDIKEVEGSNHNRPKLGPLYEIIIYTDSDELEINHSMENFDILVEYLLDKYENGEINNKAISKDSHELLLKVTHVKKK